MNENIQPEIVKDQIGLTVAKHDGIKIIGSKPIVWGVGDISKMLPVKNAPPGEQRIVMANKTCAKIYIKNGNSVRCFNLVKEDGMLAVDPSMEQKGDYYFPAMPELP